MNTSFYPDRYTAQGPKLATLSRKKSSPYSLALTAALALIPVVGYALIIGKLSYNLPIFDDYIVQLETASIAQEPTWLDKLSIVFSQLNEHRIAYTRFWFWFLSIPTGSIPYSWLIFVGNVSLLGLLLVIWTQVRRLAVPLSVWIPICWLIFQFQFYPNSLWAMGSLQNLTVHFFCLWLFVLILQPGRFRFVAACLVATLLVYTSGNGLIAPVLSLVPLAYQRRYRAMAIWGGLLLIVLGSYFWNYQPVQQFETSQPIDIPTWIAGVMVFLALGLKFPFVSIAVLVVLGILFLLLALSMSFASIGRLLRNRERLQKPEYTLMVVCMLIYAFVLLSAIVVVRGRWVLGQWDGVIQPRYFFYSIMWMVALYLHGVAFFANKIRQNAWIVWMVLGVFVIYWGLTLQYNLARMLEFRDRALSDYVNWEQVQKPDQKEFNKTVFVPSQRDQQTVQQIRTVLNQQGAISPCGSIEKMGVTPNGESFLIAPIKAPQSSDNWRYLIMQSPRQTLLMPVVYYTNPGVRSFWFGKTWFMDRAISEALTFVATDSSYRIGLLQRNEGQLSVCYSNAILYPSALKKAQKNP